MRSPFLRERAARHTYWSDVSESGERDGLATGLAAALGGGRAFSVARAGFGLAAGATVAGARTTGFVGVAASGSLATAATAGFGPAVGATFVVVIDLAAGAGASKWFGPNGIWFGVGCHVVLSGSGVLEGSLLIG